MGGAFHLNQHRDLKAAFQPSSWCPCQLRLAHLVELHLLFQAITGYILLHTSDHSVDAGADGVPIRFTSQQVNRIPHHQRRFGRVKDNNGLAMPCAAYLLNGVTGGFSKFINISAGAGPGGAAGDRRNNFRVVHRRDAGNCRHHGNGRLTAAGHHVDVAGLYLVEVNRRDHIWADGRRRQVNHLNTVLLQLSVVVRMRTGGSGVKHYIDTAESLHLQQSVNSFRRGGNAPFRRASESFGTRVDANHRTHFQMTRVAHHLNHQIGTDIAGPDNSDFYFFSHG